MTTINRTMRVGMILALGMLFLGIRSDASSGDFYPSYTDVEGDRPPGTVRRIAATNVPATR